MNSLRLLFPLCWLFSAVPQAFAQNEDWQVLADFDRYQAEVRVSGQGSWRKRGVSPANSARIVLADGAPVLGLGPREIAIFDAPDRFAIGSMDSGAVSFRIRLSAEAARHDDAFMFIVKTRAQAEADLTRPVNGLLLLQFAFDQASGKFRMRLEGPGPSPTDPVMSADTWYQVTVRLDQTTSAYEVVLTQGLGAMVSVTNHLYRDGLVPYKNPDPGAAEVIYLRNHNLPGRVEIDDLRFKMTGALSNGDLRY